MKLHAVNMMSIRHLLHTAESFFWGCIDPKPMVLTNVCVICHGKPLLILAVQGIF
jgi:hypothetical protein